MASMPRLRETRDDKSKTSDRSVDVQWYRMMKYFMEGKEGWTQLGDGGTSE